MERVVRAVSRCATTYSRMRHNKELLRSSFSTSTKWYGRFEPDEEVSPTYIPEHNTINVRLHSFDYVLLEGFSKHVQKMASYFDLDADYLRVPAFKQEIVTLKPRSKFKEDSYKLNRYERVVQLNSVPSTILPVFLEFVRNNCPQSVTVTVKEATAEDDDFRYIPDIQKEKLEKDLAELIGDRKK